MKRHAFFVLAVLAANACFADITDVEARMRLEESEEHLATAESGSKHARLVDKAALAALQAGDLDKARIYGDELGILAETMRASYPSPTHRVGQCDPLWNYGNLVHHHHLIRGGVALASGDVQTAIKELHEAGKTPGSPQLDTFGPNMLLAKALLERGQRDAVLTYLEQCRKFWEDGLGQLDEWKAEIGRGETPDFKANLLYW